MINNKEELIKELKANNGKIYLPHCALGINNMAVHNDDYEIRMIYMDLTTIGTDDDLVEFCDSWGLVILSIFLKDINEFEILWEYDNEGCIKG